MKEGRTYGRKDGSEDPFVKKGGLLRDNALAALAVLSRLGGRTCLIGSTVQWSR